MKIESQLNVKTPVFTRRDERQSYQVRFWSTPDLYKSFREEIAKHDLVIQDVFNDFMKWFVSSKEKVVK